MQPELIAGVPAGSLTAFAAPSGWISEELFYQWFIEVFLESVQPKHRPQKNISYSRLAYLAYQKYTINKCRLGEQCGHFFIASAYNSQTTTPGRQCV